VKRQNVTSDESVKRQNVTSDESVKRQNVTSQDEIESVKRQNVTSDESVKRQNVTSDESVKRQNVTSDESVKRQNVTSDESVKRQNVTSQAEIEGVKRQNVTSQDEIESVKRQNVTSQAEIESVKRQNVTSQDDLATVNVNVNQLCLLFKKLINTVNVNVNRFDTKIFEPIVTFTEQLLEDNHSTGMLYKRLKALYPDDFDLYIQAVQTALIIAEDDPLTNKGAIFVKTLQTLADDDNIDLKKSNFYQKNSSQTFVEMQQIPTETDTQISMRLAQLLPAPSSPDEILWEETKVALRHQMTQATYSSIVQSTELLQRDGNYYIIGTPTEMAKAWLVDRLAHTIERTLSGIVGEKAVIEFKLINKTK
jgi:uncharacterized protein YdcH (DUF465 family)